MKRVDHTGERISPEADYNSYIEQLCIYDFFAKRIQEIDHKDLHLIDCASGTGYGLEYLTSNTSLVKNNCIGVDISPEAVEFSQQRYPLLKYIQGNILEIYKKYNDLDIFTCNQTLEHFIEGDQVMVIDSIYQSVKRGGFVMIGVPNKPVYQMFDPNNKFHLNELDFYHLKKIIEAKNWTSTEYFLQMMPKYQDSPLRRSRLIKILLSILPVKLLQVIANMMNPKIKISDLSIQSYIEEDLNHAKYLIVICKK